MRTEPSLAPFTALYELTMAQACWQSGQTGRATFSLSFRKYPGGPCEVQIFASRGPASSRWARWYGPAPRRRYPTVHVRNGGPGQV